MVFFPIDSIVKDHSVINSLSSDVEVSQRSSMVENSTICSIMKGKMEQKIVSIIKALLANYYFTVLPTKLIEVCA